jgi:hypothetical protein
MSTNPDILISAGVRVDVSSLKNLDKEVKKSLKVTKMLRPGEGILPKNFEKSFTNINSELKTLGATWKEIDMSKAAKAATQNLNTEIKAIKKTEGAFKQFRGALLGASLSMLFFGMALKRVFDTAWRFGTKTFNDIMHSVEGTVTGFDEMNNSMAYLGFTIGQALEPVAAFLAPIIMAFANWVSENQTLVSTLLIVTGVLGTILFVAGTLGSAFAGLTGLASIFGVTLGGLGAAVGTVLLPILAVVAAAILLWQTNLGGFRTFFLETFGIMWNNLKSVFSNIYNAFKRLFSGDLVGFLAELVAGTIKNIFSSRSSYL